MSFFIKENHQKLDAKVWQIFTYMLISTFASCNLHISFKVGHFRDVKELQGHINPRVCVFSVFLYLFWGTKVKVVKMKWECFRCGCSHFMGGTFFTFNVVRIFQRPVCQCHCLLLKLNVFILFRRSGRSRSRSPFLYSSSRRSSSRSRNKRHTSSGLGGGSSHSSRPASRSPPSLLPLNSSLGAELSRRKKERLAAEAAARASGGTSPPSSAHKPVSSSVRSAKTEAPHLERDSGAVAEPPPPPPQPEDPPSCEDHTAAPGGATASPSTPFAPPQPSPPVAPSPATKVPPPPPPSQQEPVTQLPVSSVTSQAKSPAPVSTYSPLRQTALHKTSTLPPLPLPPALLGSILDR